jgi:acyl-CoA synthetase (AMP-forming)/AMP-acid ligase II
MPNWETRLERHYDDRMVRCFVDRPKSVYEIFQAAVRRRPQGVALVAGNVRLTYLELDHRATNFASHLHACGLRAGDRLGILLGNHLEFAAVVLAAARIGLIVVPINERQRRSEIVYMLVHSQAACLVISSNLLQELPETTEIPNVRNVFEVGGHAIPGARSFDDQVNASARTEAIIAGEEDPFCILYTSGTTGRPKGAVLTHLGIVHSVLHYQMALGLVEGDVAVMAVPATHVTGLVAIFLSVLRVAGTTVMMETFKAHSFLELAQRERMTYTLMVPAMYILSLLDLHFLDFDLGSWRVGGFGGAPMSVTTIERLARDLPSLSLANIYGATETTSPASMLLPGSVARQPDSVGQALPCAEIIICDEDGNKLKTGECGELRIAGPMTIPRYWSDSDADQIAFVNGFWRSGDLGTIDANGFIRVLDRKKDMINRAGFKVYCSEVENLIAAYPNVQECALVGRPDPILGERSHVFVVANSKLVDADGLKRYCAQHLSDYKVPDFFTLLDTPLPRNGNGKIQKAELRKRAISE